MVGSGYLFCVLHRWLGDVFVPLSHIRSFSYIHIIGCFDIWVVFLTYFPHVYICINIPSSNATEIYPVIMDTTWPLDNTIGYSKFCITNHLKSKLQSVCIFLIKDKNCNTVCTSPEGGMDIQIKTLHRCMNEYNSSLQYVKGGGAI